VDQETINIADLRLDETNPRHEPARSQRDIITALLTDDGGKLVRLAEDIATQGLSPIDLFLVLREPGPKYTVIEGNRRLAAVKLLANPDLTSIPRYAARFRVLRKKMTGPIHEVPCAVVASRDEAKHWQLLRHHGQAEGRGVVPWDTEASTRFFGRRGTHAEKALSVLDAVETAFPDNKTLQANLKDVRKNRPTTFGRLVGDPFVREKLGLELTPAVGAHYPSEILEPAIEQILEDLTSGAVTVSGLKSRQERREYILGLGEKLPRESAYEVDARPFVPPGTPRPAPSKPKPGPKPAKPSVKALFDGVHLTNLGARVGDILTELQQLDVEKYPNASAALLRVVVELAVTEVHVKKGWPIGPHDKLKDLVRKCVNELDPTQKDPRYQPVRAGLADGTSVFAVATIHAYLHNPNYHPTPSELRSTSANYGPFLAALDTLV
jgi:hypothetical protein